MADAKPVPDPVELRRLIAEALEVPSETLDEDTTFDDLNATSLMRLEIAVSVEEHYRVQFDDRELALLTSVSQVAEVLSAKLADRSASSP